MEHLSTELSFVLYRDGGLFTAWRPGVSSEDVILADPMLQRFDADGQVLRVRLRPPITDEDVRRWDAPVKEWMVEYEFGRFEFANEDERAEADALVCQVAEAYQRAKLRPLDAIGRFIVGDDLDLALPDDTINAKEVFFTGGRRIVQDADRLTVEEGGTVFARRCRMVTLGLRTVAVLEACAVVSSKAAMLRAMQCGHVIQDRGVLWASDCEDLRVSGCVVRAARAARVHLADSYGSVVEAEEIRMAGVVSLMLSTTPRLVLAQSARAVVYAGWFDGVTVILEPGSRLILVSDTSGSVPLRVTLVNHGGQIHTIGNIQIEEVRTT